MGRPRKNPQPESPFVANELQPEPLPGEIDYSQVQVPVREPQPTPPQREELEAPQNNTLRRVEVLANLANACKSKELLKVLSGMPDGKIIMGIFSEAIQLKIQQIMSGQEQAEVMDLAQGVRENMDVVSSLADKLQTFFVQLHQSPLLSVLNSLNKNLEAKAAAPQPMQQSPYQTPPQQNWQNQPPPPQQPVTPYYESQIEQTPQHTAKRAASNNGPAPTAPPRGNGINSW